MRYRLWALIRYIIEMDEGKTPVQDRTIDWLVDKYRELRNSGDLDVDHDSNWPRPYASKGEASNVDMRTEGEGPQRRHDPSHISRADARGYFAAQCEWLLAQQLAPGHRNFWRVNMIKWVKFCTHAQTARKKALESGIRWGLPFGVTVVGDESLAARLSQFGGSVQFWDRELRNLEVKWSKVVKEQVCFCYRCVMISLVDTWQ
jgi:hypothetical protein